MNTQMNKTIALIFVIALVPFGMNAAAQNNPPNGQARKAAVAELRERFQEWAQGEVVPQLTEWKRTLDAAMAPDDLATLNDLRGRAAELRKTARVSAAALHTAWCDEDYGGVKRYRAQLTEVRKQFLDLADLLTPLAIEYHTTLQAIGADAQPHVEVWKREGKEIWESWKAEYGDIVPDGAGRFIKRTEFVGGLLHPEISSERRMLLFMVWNGGRDAGEPEANVGMDQPALK